MQKIPTFTIHSNEISTKSSLNQWDNPITHSTTLTLDQTLTSTQDLTLTLTSIRLNQTPIRIQNLDLPDLKLKPQGLILTPTSTQTRTWTQPGLITRPWLVTWLFWLDLHLTLTRESSPTF